ncbi:rhodanese-like domain-containing protein [Arcicella lustrica]|uniref:Rhodanese-like domain-containing protein n=1 Tax=Arcicella lustrica TaxID=2984196 RepID=A0ABU5SK58_9BACT|nr:rhodanese-like domain-containing protein [Arcicella sp. DC25W]MEA5427681.1 rhodanese-like domain-containing protein [Arcicella sp. DC25W]
MKKRLFSKIDYWFVVLFLVLTSCSNTQSLKNINSVEFKSLIVSNKNLLILDVRTDIEVASGIIPEAIQVDYTADNFEQKIAQLDKNKTVFVYCATGGRSAAAASVLAGNGFEHVYNLEGGIEAWKEKGFSVVKNNN